MNKRILNSMLTLGSTTSALGFATSALAHEGHGTPGHGNTVQHYLLEPSHIPVAILVVAAVIVSAIYFARIVNRRRTERRIEATQNR